MVKRFVMVKKISQMALAPFIVYTLFFILLLSLAGGEELDSVRSFIFFAFSGGVALLITLAWVKLWTFISRFK